MILHLEAVSAERSSLLVVTELSVAGSGAYLVQLGPGKISTISRVVFASWDLVLFFWNAISINYFKFVP